MILVDKPYLSEFLKETSKKYNLPIIQTQAAREMGLNENDNLIAEDAAIAKLQRAKNLRLYTTSENAIGWIAKNLNFTPLPEKIELFKNKVKFRALTRSMLPDFYFREIPFTELDTLDINEIPLPFIIKPNIGFFSMGVHKVSSADDWDAAKRAVRATAAQKVDLYPAEVLNTDSFIIEQYVFGEEFAFDAYFDHESVPVILGIYKHLFSSDHDVSDRIYITSKEIIADNLEPFTAWLQQIGDMAGVRNFPVHVEIRRGANGKIIPIEVNPMRFGGWCTTADMTAAAFGHNPYVYYFEGKRPDWEHILSTRAGKIYSLVVLDNSTGYPGEQIASFDYQALLGCFEKPLELRELNYRQFPVFGFLFLETKADNFAELERILKSDLREFTRLASQSETLPT